MVWASLCADLEDDEPIFPRDESEGRAVVPVNVNGSDGVGVVYRSFIPFTESSHLVGSRNKADAGAGGDGGHEAENNWLSEKRNYSYASVTSTDSARTAPRYAVEYDSDPRSADAQRWP